VGFEVFFEVFVEVVVASVDGLVAAREVAAALALTLGDDEENFAFFAFADAGLVIFERFASSMLSRASVNSEFWAGWTVMAD